MSKTHQQGSTLIIVLIVLLLITIIGTIAIRNSTLNLRLSSSHQISNLLIESSDTALVSLENPKFINERLLATGMYGYFLLSGNEQDELTFCFNARNPSFFSLSKASVIGSTKRGVEGYCKENTFSTGRNAVITQVYLRKVSAAESEPFSVAPQGTGLGTGNIFSLSKNVMGATVVSILPAFSGITNDELQDCFKKTADQTNSENVVKCFSDENVPYNIQYAEFAVGTGA